jgi:anti-sigma factor RsiW
VSHPKDDLTALLDGALPPDRATEVERHLATCDVCRAERDRLSGALALLAALPPAPAPSPTFEARLSARLAREARPAPGFFARLVPWRWRIAVPTAALAASAAVALLVVRAQRAEEASLAAHLDLLEEYEVVVGLGDVDTEEDAAVVAHLDELGSSKEGRP